MTTKITVTAGTVTLSAELNDTPTAQAVAEALPVAGEVMRWGQEVYFETPVVMDAGADARAEVHVGEIGYWPAGRAVCIFFGPTPASGPDGAPRAASPVNPIGTVLGDVSALDGVGPGTEITLAADGG